MFSKLLQTSALFTLLSILASGLNFLYYPFIARALSYAQFGEVQIGIAFIMQASALFLSLNILSLYFTAQSSDRSQLASRLERFVIAVSLVMAVVCLLFARPLADALQLGDTGLLYLLSAIFLLNIPTATWLGALQGNGQFITSGIISVAASVTKIVASLLFISLGLGSFGALLGIIIGTAVMLPLAYLMQRGNIISFRKTFSRLRRHDLLLFRDHPSLMFIFFSLFLLALASTVDVLFSKAGLDPTTAGRYAELSTAGKIPYFAAVPLAIILFERFIRRQQLSWRPVGLYTLFVLLAAGGIIVLQRWLLPLFFGTGSYDGTAFIMLCAAFSCYAITTLLVYRLLSRRLVIRTVYICLISLVLPIVLLSFNASTPRDIAGMYLIGQFITVCLAAGVQYTRTHG